MMKRMIAAAAAAAMLCASVTVVASETESGSCGDNLTWTLDESGLLTVSGTGTMDNYTFIDPAPWADSDVRDVVIEEGVTSVGTYAFMGQTGIETVTLSATVTKIDIGAFQEIGDSFTAITIPPSVTFIGQYAFALNANLVIKGYPGSYAEEYALNQGITFESLGDVPLNDVTVSTVEELEAAIRSFNRIILKDGVYTIDHPLTIGSDSEYITNVTITAENPGRAEILSTLGYEPVAEIVNAFQIMLEGLILGHESPEYQQGCGSSEYSSGYVLYANRADDVTINGCDLYGCGTVALYLEASDNFTAENCILRDCKESIASLWGENININGCIISGNAYDPKYAGSIPAIWATDHAPTFCDCVFVNNCSAEFAGGTAEVITTDCTFVDNAWDSETPEDWGVCLNGINWQVKDGVLRLGYPIELDDGTSIESGKGEILPYSVYSLPWRGKVYSTLDVAPGVYYYGEGSGSCGDNAAWSLKNGVLNISGTGDMYAYNSAYRPDWENAKDVITEVIIEDGITSLGNMAFMEYPSLKSVTLPNSLEVIGANAFTRCKSLSKVSWGSGLKEIGMSAFSNCPITSAVLPEGLTTLGTQAFSGSALMEIKLPSTIETFDADVFRGCNELASVEISDGNALYKSLEGVLFTEDMKTLVFAPAAKPVSVYVVPDGVDKIGSFAFEGSRIGEIVISDSVTELETNAIRGFKGERIVIPKNVIKLGENSVFIEGAGEVYVYEDSAAEKYFADTYMNYKIIPELSKAQAYADENGIIQVFLETDSQNIVPVFAVCMREGELTEVGELSGGVFATEGADTVKLFIWDGFDTMRPLAEADTVWGGE